MCYILLSKLTRVLEALDVELLAVEADLELLSLGGGHGAGDVVRAAGEEGARVSVEGVHLEAGEVGGEGDLGVVSLVGGLELGDSGLALGPHVVVELLEVTETVGGINAFDGEGGGEDVGELGCDE